MAKCMSGSDRTREQGFRGNSNESMMEMLVCSLGGVLGLGVICLVIGNCPQFLIKLISKGGTRESVFKKISLLLCTVLIE